MHHWGSRYVRSIYGNWFAVHQRDGTWVTNRYGTQFYRSGSEVWRDISLSEHNTLEHEFKTRTAKDLDEQNAKFLHWGKIVRTMAVQGFDSQNTYTQDLAEMLELLRVNFYAPKIKQLSTMLDEISVKK